MARSVLGIAALIALMFTACAGGDSVGTSTLRSTSTTTTSAAPTTTKVVSHPAFLYDLVEGHNDLGLDRINLVFVPYGWDDLDAFVDLAETFLSFDTKPVLVDDTSLEFGPFAIESWRSNRELFNVWYTQVEPPEPVSYTSMGETLPEPVPDAVIVTLAVDWPYGAASGFTGFIPPDLPDRSVFADPVGLTISIASSDPLWGNPQVLAHELGHAVFGLSDEYVGQELGYDGRPDLSSFPACAADEDEATDWWHDRRGDVDPMFSIWMEAMQDAGLGLTFDVQNALRSDVMVGLVDGGCYGPSGSVRATFDSLMNTNIPVLGTVNRDWAEQVFAQYTGTPQNS